MHIGASPDADGEAKEEREKGGGKGMKGQD